ncbi:hypothetical protein HYH02_009659 [Chlamydomonas schloesseri]|uniref:F-box domain-containing protein n=1 Tax=Chlamydomonas schloesseri TaxID=2026947 RepID=A0A835TDP4_9CHLO|nr:hypothetical protein HYH02_009659 [Chlamydomonas schloesseri]|eukprot:KAG2442171.1 hypothetical protein HYH02_009659 [Chlamydomonas schloesseri]
MGGPIIVHPLFQHTLATPPAPEPRTLEEVPEDVLRLIAQRLPTAQQLCVLACVNRRCKAVAEAEELWRAMCVTRFAITSHCSPPSWRKLYEFNHSFLYKVLLSRSAEQFNSGFSRSGGGFVGMGIAIA